MRMRINCEESGRHAIPERWWQGVMHPCTIGYNWLSPQRVQGQQTTRFWVTRLLLASVIWNVCISEEVSKRATGTLDPDYCLTVRYRWEAISIALNPSQHIGLQKQAWNHGCRAVYSFALRGRFSFYDLLARFFLLLGGFLWGRSIFFFPPGLVFFGFDLSNSPLLTSPGCHKLVLTADPEATQ